MKQLKLREIDSVYFLCKSALLLFFIADGCNKLLLTLQSDFFRVSIFVRSIYELLFLSVIILFLNETRLIFLNILFVLFLVFISGQILVSLNVSYSYRYIENISNFNKYLFIFVIYLCIYKFSDYPEKFLKIIKLMENLFIINSIAIIAGFIFEIEFFRTYVGFDYKKGYSGFIPAQNEATLFYVIVISYFYYKHFFLNIKSKYLYLVLFSSLFLGTKSIYIFLVFLMVFHFLYFSSLKSKIITFILMAAILTGGYLYLQTQHSKVLLEYFISSKNKQGWIPMLLSGRNFYISDRIPEMLGHWTPINYFIGGQDLTKWDIEMDFLNLFFFLGIIGSTIFLSLYFLVLFRFNVLRPFNFFFVFSFFTLAFFGGHFFASAVNSLYLCLFLMYLYFSQNKFDCLWGKYY